MPEFVTVGAINTASIRAYLFAKTINEGDTLLLNAQDFEHITDEIKQSAEAIDIPLSVLGVHLVKDTTGDVPAGKMQVIKNEQV